MSEQEKEPLDELVRRATEEATAPSATEIVEEEYVLPENPYERQALDSPSPTAATRKTKPAKARKGRKAKDVPYDAELSEERRQFTFWDVVGGNFLAGQWLRSNVGYIVMITCFVIAYVANGYRVSDRRIEQHRLRDTLEDRRLRDLTLSSELTRQTRISSVEEALKDTAINLANDNVYTLPITEETE